ncbi:MAG: aminotransferase class I/II-fold pyridoxal phosphate-dependent enzyme, partial [Magnetococcales bacterium]|nr:aminotransferase class I/II-fold pyridoxal phosphate-dependent enzyme [Magnetococcales bacterium]
MIPLAVPDLSGNEALYLQECIRSGFVSSVGPFVVRLEGMVATIAASAAAVATSSGTTGLHAALTAVGVGRDDLVIVPALTFIASANAVAHCGADPWLMEIDPVSWTLDADRLAETLESSAERRETDGRGGERDEPGSSKATQERVIHRQSGRRVAAIMPVHTLGAAADMEKIVAVAHSWGLPVVADGAAALGSLYRGKPLGKSGADLTVFSFNGNKTVTAGGGGAVAGDDLPLLALVKHLTTTARVGEDYDHDRVGFNYRMTNLQAAVGCAQLERLPALLAAKRRIRAEYDAVLSEIPGLSPFPDPAWATGG